MTTIAEYEAWKAQKQQNGVSAAQVAIGASEDAPDEIARDMTLASEFAKASGNPAPPLELVKDNRWVFQAEIDKLKAAPILAKSPILTEWLRNDAQNAGVSRDDLAGLSWFEGFGRGAGATLQRGGQRFAQMGNQFMFEQAAGRAADRKKTFGQLVDDQKLEVFDADGKKLDTMSGPIEWGFALGRWIDARYADAIGTNDDAAAAHYAGKVKASVDAMAATPKSMIAQDFERDARVENGTLGDTIASYAASFTKNPVGGLSWMFETAGESAPIMAAAIGTTIATRDPIKGAAVVGGGSYLTERYVSPAEFMKEKKINLGDPNAVAALIADPTLMREAAERGVIRGAVIGAFDLLSVGVAGKSLAGNPVIEALAQTASQAFLGGGGEWAARVAAGQAIDWNEIVAEGLAEMATTPVDMGIAGRRYVRDRSKADGVAQSAEQIEALSSAAQESKLRERLPDAFRQYLDRALENGPVENVYVPAAEFVGYFQSAGVDPHELADGLEGVTREDLDDAIASGGDLKIPTATYAGKLAGTDHDAFFMENMRFDPNEFTSAEAREFNERAQDAMDEAFGVAEAARQEDERFRSFEGEIYDTMVSRLREAGRSTEVATTEATLYPAFYRTMAERSGMGVDEFMGRYPLPRVEGALPEGMQFKTVDELNRQLAEARSRRTVRDNRQSLAEFIHAFGGIDDVGGELRALGADTIKRGRGRKTLKLARTGVASVVKDMFGAMTGSGTRHGADDVALAAIEAGFMADDPIVTEYQAAQRDGKPVPDITRALWDAISAEMKGTPQHSSHDGKPQPQQEVDGINAIEEYLAGLGVSLDDDDATIRAAIGDGKQYEQAGRRGSIQLPAGGVADGQSVIRLFEEANLSTVLHESGHFYLEVLADLAARGEKSAQDDMAIVRGWWRDNAEAVADDAVRAGKGVAVTAVDVRAYLDAGTTGDGARDAAVDAGMKEQATRGFEAYLMEGKAPTSDLQAAFDKFRSWLISVYRRLKGMPGVKISDEIGRVFDRMLASDNEIARASEDVGGSEPLFSSSEQMGLTPDEYAAFLKMRAEAESDGQARLLREIMEPERREREKWYKDERARVREEVEREVSAQPVFRAIEWMGNRRWFGESQPADIADFRMSKDILVERYGAGVLKTLPRGRLTVYAVTGGLDPDDAAVWFGFQSGDQMVRAMEQAPKRAEAIDAEADRVMNERHGDPLTDGEIEAKALDAVHTEKRGDWIAAELKAVVEIAGSDAGLTAREARAAARQSIQRMRVRDATNAQRFLAAERKAGEEAARLGRTIARDKVWLAAADRRVQSRLNAKGSLRSVDALNKAIERRNALLASQDVEFEVPDRTVAGKDGKPRTVKGGRRKAHVSGYNENVAKLVDAKRRQLINHALYMEARLTAEEVERAEGFVDTLGKKEKRKAIAGAGRRENAAVDYLSAIDEVLELHDFRRVSGAAEQRRGSLLEFVDRMKAAGRANELNIDDAVLSNAARRPYKTLSVEELRGVVDTLKNLEHMALRWNTLIDTQHERVFEDTVNEVLQAFETNVKRRPPGRVKTRMEALRHSGRQYLDLVLNAGTLLREIDGFADFGPAFTNIKAPIDGAMNRLTVRKEKAAIDLEELYSVYSAAERRQMTIRKHIPELGLSLSKWELVSIALNTGNAGNLQRLTDPKVGGSFTEAQVARVLHMLDARDAKFVQSVWDFVGSFWSDIAAREKRTTGVSPQRVDASPITIGGIELAGGYYPIKYDARLSALARDDETQALADSLAAGRFGKAQTRSGHLKERSRASGRDIDLSMSVLHAHVGQVIHDLEVSEPVTNAWRIITDGRVRAQFTEAGRSADFEALETWLKDVAEGELRQSDLISRLARTAKSNFTAAKLAFNFATVAVQVTGLAQTMVVVGKQDFARGLQASFRPGVLDEIAAKSTFMRSRQTTFNKDIYDLHHDPMAGPIASRWAKVRSDVIGKYGFWLMTKVQWHIVDVPTWLAGYHQGLRQFKNDETKAVAHADDVVKRAQASGLFSDRSAVERGSRSRVERQSDLLRLFTTLASYMFAKFNVAYERTGKAKRTIEAEGVSTASVQEAMSWTLDMAMLFTLEAVLVAAIKGRLPGEDDEDESWVKFLAKETGLSLMATLPGFRDVAGPLQGFQGGGAYGSMTKEAADLPWQIGQGELDWGLLRATVNATGLATGLPAVQLNRVLGAGIRQSDGEDVRPLEYLMGKMGKP